jgi:phosphocarrier protein HPr
MKERVFTIKNKMGLHARPASVLVQAASRFKSDVRIRKDAEEINAKSIMGMFLLQAAQGAKLTVKVSGPDEDEAMEAIAQVFESDKVFLEE